MSYRKPEGAEEAEGGSKRWIEGFLSWLGVVLCLGLLLFFYRYLAVLAGGGVEDPRKPLIQEMTAVFGAGLLFFPLRWWVRRFPLSRGTWVRRLPLYMAVALAFSALHTTSNWALREALFRLAGLGDYDYGILPLRYLMELPVDLLGLSLIVAALHAAERVHQAREQELRAARLEGILAKAQLSNLRLQLQPHFLFNALNTISATMYEDPAAADEMLDRLAELLRASLRTAGANEVSLEKELELLECYLAVLRARFRERLEVEVAVEPGTRSLRVPSMVLQPLVENAVRHGGAERLGRGRIAVRARLAGPAGAEGVLLLEVEDDGPGAPPGEDLLSQGLGLSATGERLRRLYGTRYSLAAGNRREGGFRVALHLPARPAEEEERGETPTEAPR